MVPVGRVSGKAGIFSRAGRLLNVFLKKGKGREKVPWSFLDVAVFTIMVYILICNDFFGAGSGIIQLLRSNYLIFTRDNRLFYYMAVCVNTMVLKVFCVLFIAILAVIRRTRFSSTLISGGTMPAAWGTWMLPLYISICFALRAFVLNGPLTANIPFNSVFPGAKILGNIFLIFSIIFVAPFVEEIIFRGFIYPAFNRYMGIFPAIILTSIIFTASHFPQIRFDYVFIIVLFLLSGIITYTRAMTGSTRIAIIMHIIYNSVAIAVGYFDYVIFRI
jgi:membrane protease YdiL (CAAX protease family)